MAKDIPTKFWNGWLHADEEKRIKLVQKTLIARELTEHLLMRLKNSKISRKHVQEIAARHMNDYFEDLETAFLARKT